jgi:hypothetical protein
VTILPTLEVIYDYYMFRHAVMQYRVHEYIMDTYACEKCKFTLFIDPSYYIKKMSVAWLVGDHLL